MLGWFLENYFRLERATEEGCQHVRDEPIVETFNGKRLWRGIVSTLTSQSGKTVYAWAVELQTGEPQYVAVIEGPKLQGPLNAVRVWLVSQIKSRKSP